jgi:hypothetical protein
MRRLIGKWLGVVWMQVGEMGVEGMGHEGVQDWLVRGLRKI